MENSNAQLEEDLIGTALFGLEEANKILSVDPSLFYYETNRNVFLQVRENHEKGIPLDNNVEARHLAIYAGKYLHEIDPAIKELGVYKCRRDLLSVLQKSVTDLSRNEDPDVVSANLLSMVSKSLPQADSISKFSDSLFEVFQRINDIREGNLQMGLRTGLDFEKHLGGFEDGKLYIVAARPAMGKSAFALEIIKRLAEKGNAVGMMSLEMAHTSLSMRLLTSAVQIDATSIKNATLTEDDMESITNQCNELAKLPIYFDDSSFVTAKTLRSRASYLKSRYDIKALVIDYLQLMTGDNDSRERDIAEISRMCKVISKELSIPVIALAQLNRGVEVRDSKRPRLSDLRESGAIEQDADAVMFLYRPEYYGIDHYDDRDPQEFRGESTQNICEVIIGKNRDGETGIVRQVFVPNLMKFSNMERHWADLDVFKS